MAAIAPDPTPARATQHRRGPVTPVIARNRENQNRFAADERRSTRDRNTRSLCPAHAGAGQSDDGLCGGRIRQNRKSERTSIDKSARHRSRELPETAWERKRLSGCLDSLAMTAGENRTARSRLAGGTRKILRG
jgi:hypothetical protein